MLTHSSDLIRKASFIAFLLLFCPAAFAAERPNILLIVADDLGWKDVGYHGSKCRTPNLDNLAASGVEFDQHYVQPVCSPTRAALLSGRYPSRFGPHAIAPTNRRVFPKGTATLASTLKSAGYHTYLAGKWHLGSREEWGPRQYGFDKTYGSLVGAVDPWTHQYRAGSYTATWHRDDQITTEKGNATELIAKQVLEWIDEKHDPWFIYVPFHAVHIPIDTPPEYKKQYENETFYKDPVKDESFKRYAAFVSQMDAKIGQFVAALEATGQRDNTLILFFSDNGGLPSGGNPYLGGTPPTPVLGSNKPLRGRKDTLYEGGIRVPAFVNWPGKLEPSKVKSPMHVVDWMPTLTKLVGCEVPENTNWDGEDVWPRITGASQAAREPRTFYWAHAKAYALRDGDWKLIAHRDGRVELFDLSADPYEKNNLAEREAERVEELKAKLEAFQQNDAPEVPEDLRDVPER